MLTSCQKGFADVIKLNILRWWDYSKLSSWVQCNLRVLIGGKAKDEWHRGRCDNNSRGKRKEEERERERDRFESATLLALTMEKDVRPVANNACIP